MRESLDGRACCEPCAENGKSLVINEDEVFHGTGGFTDLKGAPRSSPGIGTRQRIKQPRLTLTSYDNCSSIPPTAVVAFWAAGRK